ncbi:MAG: hypothetical protein ACYTE3_22420 [Planctomycetota bacterium]|jgi:hypothetical protein
MDLSTKSDYVRTRIEDMELPNGSSLSGPETRLGEDATGSPEYVHTFNHEIEGKVVQTFEVCVFEQGIAVRYGNAMSNLLPLTSIEQVEEAVGDIRTFLKRGYNRAMGGETERRRNCGMAT